MTLQRLPMKGQLLGRSKKSLIHYGSVDLMTYLGKLTLHYRAKSKPSTPSKSRKRKDEKQPTEFLPQVEKVFQEVEKSLDDTMKQMKKILDLV